MVDEKEVDKFAARCIEVKKMMARQASKDELARSQSRSAGEYDEDIILSSGNSTSTSRVGTPSNHSPTRRNPLQSPKSS